MWLYYAFTSAVVLFLNTIVNPLHPDAALDLAMISDLESLAANLATISEGSKRILAICRGMNKVAFELMKAAAKRKAKKRSAGVDREDGRQKIRRGKEGVPETFSGLSARTDVATTTEDSAGQNMLASVPGNFAWGEWDQWLEDVAFE